MSAGNSSSSGKTAVGIERKLLEPDASDASSLPQAARLAEVPVVSRDAAERGLKAAADAWLETHGARGTRMAVDVQRGALLAFAVLLAVLALRRRRRAREIHDEDTHGWQASPKSTPSKERARRLWPVVGRLRAWSEDAARSALPLAFVLLPWRVVRSASAWLRGSRVPEEGASATELGEMNSGRAAGGSHHGGASVGAAGRTAPTHRRVPSAQREEAFEEQFHVFDCVPKLLASSSEPPTVLSSEALRALRRALPLRYRPCDWALLYSTDQHGCSLRTLYTRLERRGGTILVVLDSLGHTFGAFLSEDWRPSEGHSTARYFGNGETFVFKFHPTFERWGWTRENDHFVLAAPECLGFGGGARGFALYLDSSLEYGSSHPSPTFGNGCLAGSDNFKCIKCEVWGFV